MKKILLAIFISLALSLFVSPQPTYAQQCKPWPQNQCGDRCGHFDNCGGSRPGGAYSCIDHHSWNASANCCEYTGSNWEINAMCEGGPSDSVEVKGKVTSCSGPASGVKVQWMNKDRFTESYHSTPVKEVVTDSNGNFTMSVSYSVDRVFKIETNSGTSFQAVGSQACTNGGSRARHTYCQHNNMKGSTSGIDFQQTNCASPTPAAKLEFPLCSKFSWPTQAVQGSRISFHVSGYDPDSVPGTMAPNLQFYFTKQQAGGYCSIGTGLAMQGKWQLVGGTVPGLSGSVSLDTTGLPIGTYVMTTNVRDNDNQFSSGNPGPPAACGYAANNCQGTFTITAIPTVTPPRTITPTPTRRPSPSPTLRPGVSPSPTRRPTPTLRPGVSPSPTPPAQPPFSVQVNIWEGNNCAVTSTPVDASFRATIEAKLNNQPSGTNLPINHTINVPGLIPGRTSTFALKNLPSGWSRAHCSPGIVSRQQFSQGPVNFWVEEAIDPWWQSAAGDIYGYVVYSAIPAISDGFLSLKLGLSDSGAFLWGGSKNVPDNRLRETNPVYKAKTNPALSENYGYFDELTRDFEKVTLTGNAIPAMPTLTPNRQATILKKSGNLQLNASWGSSRKLVVFVDGNLRINADQAVPVGSYLHFIVQGNITIAGNVTQLEGMYSANGNIVIEQSTNRFVSKGSVVSFGTSGIKSLRSLPGVDNNTQSATKFEYRPDLVVNTPRELRSTDSSWTEVAPD